MIKGKYKWLIKDKVIEKEKKTSQDIIDIILKNRGIITDKDRKFFLDSTFEDMHNPMLLPDMQKAIKRIDEAKFNKEKIAIYGDYDVDGITSTSILYMFLKENGYDVDYYIPDRLSEGYGINIDALKQIKENNTSLIISVDTGIAAIEEVEYANTIGLDIIITDHHECQQSLPNACAVINPKRNDSEYPFKELAGVGVTFKLIHGLAMSWGNVATIWKYIDIVAIGTVADIVPLIDENRIIVKNAFNTIPSTWNIGLANLLEITGNKDKKLTSGIIGFQIAPRLNAIGRLGGAKKGVELFITTSQETAKEIVTELNEENKKRQEIEQEIYNQAIDQIEKNQELSSQKVIIVASENWHNGVVGIVASRITEKYYKPSVVLSIEDGVATGSARSIDGFSIFDALCDSSMYLERFGGHDMAAGLSIQQENMDEFIKHINEYAQVVMTEDILTRKIKIDCQITNEHISVGMAEELESLEPYGIGNPTPVFLYKGKVYNKQGIGTDGKHLKMKLYGENILIDAIGFNMGEQKDIIGTNEDIEIIVNLQKNHWLGNTTPQLLIKDIQSPQEEIIKSKYYLSLYKNFPNLTMENYSKAFTKDVKICYINDCGKNKDISLIDINQLEYIIPTRGDCVGIYRYIKQLYTSGISEISMHLLKRELNLNKLTEYKILQVFDIFKELELIKYVYSDDIGIIVFEILDGIKTDLNNSIRYMNLVKFEEDLKNFLNQK